MKKVLILTLSTGGGHNEVARNLSVGFTREGFEALILNAFEVVYPEVDRVVSKSYSLLADKLPNLYSKLYYSMYQKPAKKMIGQTLNTITSRRNSEAIRRFKPDLIVSTHCFPVPVIGKMKRTGQIRIPLLSIITDFFPNSLYVDESVDAYIVASNATKKNLISFGVPKDIVYPYGIPIKEEFFSESAHRVDRSHLQVLLAGGSMGMSAIETILSQLTNLKGPYQFHVLCGNNESLREKLSKAYSYDIVSGRVKVYGFIHNISELMDQADLMITKPGGLTTSECLKKGLPMIIPYFIPGQEEENLEFLVKEGLARYVPNPEDVPGVVEELLNDRPHMAAIRAKMQAITEEYSVNNIIALGKRLIDEYESKGDPS